MTIEEANIKFLNKMVLVDNAHNGSTIGGKCEYIGKNEFLNWELQVTVGRMPIRIKSLDQIRLNDYKS